MRSTLFLSPLNRFGTSTWTSEGWQGQVYKKQYAKSVFAMECLGEYCQYQYNNEPLFRTVGNAPTFYRPPIANQVRIVQDLYRDAINLPTVEVRW